LERTEGRRGGPLFRQFGAALPAPPSAQDRDYRLRAWLSMSPASARRRSGLPRPRSSRRWVSSSITQGGNRSSKGMINALPTGERPRIREDEGHECKPPSGACKRRQQEEADDTDQNNEIGRARKETEDLWKDEEEDLWKDEEHERIPVRVDLSGLLFRAP